MIVHAVKSTNIEINVFFFFLQNLVFAYAVFHIVDMAGNIKFSNFFNDL